MYAMKPKILVAEKIHKNALDLAATYADVTLETNLTPQDLVRKIPGYDALVVRSATKVTKEVINAAGNLKIIGRAGVGLDNIDVDAASKKGILVVNSPEASSIAVAELVFGALLALNRKIVHAHTSMKSGKWERSKFEGSEVYAKTLGIIGFGRIGREVAMRAKAFGMHVLVYDPNITAESCASYDVRYYKELNEMLKHADVVTIHVPLTPKTKDLIGKEQFRLMKKSSVVINIARGGIINEEALYDALKENTIRGAALDVYVSEPHENSPFAELDNIVLTPHLGASTEEAQINAGTVVVEKIKEYFMNK
jgi:D-3-phosphoglycerate dehydrogenase